MYISQLFCNYFVSFKSHVSRLKSHREQTCGCQGGERVEERWMGIWGQQMQTRIHRMVNNEALPPSTGNYIQYPLINHNGKEYAYICITESLCYIAVMNTTLYINYISVKKRRQPCFFKLQHFLLVGRKSPQVIRPYCGAKYAGNSQFFKNSYSKSLFISWSQNLGYISLQKVVCINTGNTTLLYKHRKILHEILQKQNNQKSQNCHPHILENEE